MIKKMNCEYKIYVHINKINNKLYIGQTRNKYINSRWRNGKGYSHSPHFYNAIKKYGWDNFEHIILIDKIYDYRIADIIESELIKKYNTTDRKYGYNISSGGSNGHALSEESKNKMSKRMMGNNNPMYHKKFSDEHLEKLSKSHKGIVQSEEWINKRKMYGNKNPMYGKNVSEKTKKLISDKTKGGKNASAKECYLFSNIDDIKKYECLSYAYKTISMGKSYCRKHRLTGIYENNTNRVVFILTTDELNTFTKWCNNNNNNNNKRLDITDIQSRYKLYNEWLCKNKVK